jgi:hypothetical protein
VDRKNEFLLAILNFPGEEVRPKIVRIRNVSRPSWVGRAFPSNPRPAGKPGPPSKFRVSSPQERLVEFVDRKTPEKPIWVREFL